MPIDHEALDQILGKDPKYWPVSRLVDYPPNLNRRDVAKGLVKALRLAKNDIAEAQESILSIDSNGLKRFFIDIAQHAGGWRYRYSAKTQKSPPAKRTKRVIPARRELLQLFARDRYCCRYCGTPVVGDRKQFVLLAERLSMPALVATGGNEVRHGLYLTFRASHDHLKPLEDGGTNDFHNLLTACWPCQFGKYRFSLEDLGLKLSNEIPSSDPEWLSSVVGLLPET